MFVTFFRLIPLTTSNPWIDFSPLWTLDVFYQKKGKAISWINFSMKILVTCHERNDDFSKILKVMWTVIIRLSWSESSAHDSIIDGQLLFAWYDMYNYCIYMFRYISLFNMYIFILYQVIYINWMLFVIYVYLHNFVLQQCFDQKETRTQEIPLNPKNHVLSKTACFETPKKSSITSYLNQTDRRLMAPLFPAR